MAKVCEVCQRGPRFGNRVSHAHNITKRRWNLNLQTVHAVVKELGQWYFDVRVRLWATRFYETLVRGGQHIHLVGIDDAHYYRVDNIEKAVSQVPGLEFSILLSHTPEIYRQAAHAGFKLLLSGHTHGGQICLPGAIPLTLDSVLPRRMGAGAWKYHDMVGYTSVGVGSSIVPVRLNCPPEITLHCLRCDRRQT